MLVDINIIMIVFCEKLVCPMSINKGRMTTSHGTIKALREFYYFFSFSRGKEH